MYLRGYVFRHPLFSCKWSLQKNTRTNFGPASPPFRNGIRETSAEGADGSFDKKSEHQNETEQCSAHHSDAHP